MQLRAETTARRLKTRDLRQNFQTFKSILNSGALFFSLDKDKKVIRISQVSDHDRSKAHLDSVFISYLPRTSGQIFV